jgi:DNA-binding MarR family transcriptional regulator
MLRCLAVRPPVASPDADTRAIIDLANELVGRIFTHLLARAAELNLSLPEAKAVQHLEAQRALSMRELAARLNANPSNVTVIVGRLEARGLLSRELGADRRVKGVRLTRQGVELQAKLQARLLADHPAVSGLSDDDRREFVRLLRGVVAPPG